MTHIKQDRCVLPKAHRRKHRNRIWVCECGRTYISGTYLFATDVGPRSGWQWNEVEPLKKRVPK
jgi:ribosomal protein L37AE/L43A